MNPEAIAKAQEEIRNAQAELNNTSSPKENKLKSMSKEEIENLLSNYEDRPDDYVCYYGNDYEITVGEFRRQVKSIDDAVYDAKIDSINKMFTEEQLISLIDEHTRSGHPDDHVCVQAYGNTPDITLGELKQHLETIKKDRYESKKDAIDRMFTEEQLSNLINDHIKANHSDDHVCVQAYGNTPEMTLFDLRMRLDDIRKEKYQGKVGEIAKLSKDTIDSLLVTHINQGDPDDQVVMQTYNGTQLTLGDLKEYYPNINNGNEFNINSVVNGTSAPTQQPQPTPASQPVPQPTAQPTPAPQQEEPVQEENAPQQDTTQQAQSGPSPQTADNSSDKVPGEDEALQNYRNSGYDKNSFGQYFNPNVDEYDPDYNPVNDPLFNPRIRTDLTRGMSNEELLIKLMEAHNEMAELTQQDPHIGIELTNPRDDKYDLKQEQIEAFIKDRAFTTEVKNAVPEVYLKYADLLRQVDDARKKIADVMGVEPYPGIENEDANEFLNNSIQNQLDDWEIDQIKENQEKLANLRRQYPLLFANVKAKAKTEAPVPPTPGETDDKDKDKEEKPEDKEKTEDKDKEEKPEDKDKPEEKDKEEDKGKEPTPGPTPAPAGRTFDKEKAKELLTKGLCFGAGFAAGMALSCVPVSGGLGIALTGIAAVRTVAVAAKLANKGLKAWTNKHPDGKVAKVVNNINNSKVGQFVQNTSTTIANKWNNSAIGKGYNKLRAKLKESPIKYAVNGLAMGYFTGNMIELFTGRSVIDNISNKLNPDSQVVQSNPGGYTDNNLNTEDLPQGLTDSTHNTIGPDTVPDVQPVTTSIDTAKTVEEAIKAGKSVDISSLHYGGVSSVSNPIALNTAAGQHVLFDQAVILENGQEMWHMAQADAAGNLIGKGYAWFPKEQVIEAVQGLSQTGITR